MSAGAAPPPSGPAAAASPPPPAAKYIATPQFSHMCAASLGLHAQACMQTTNAQARARCHIYVHTAGQACHSKQALTSLKHSWAADSSAFSCVSCVRDAASSSRSLHARQATIPSDSHVLVLQKPSMCSHSQVPAWQDDATCRIHTLMHGTYVKHVPERICLHLLDGSSHFLQAGQVPLGQV